MGRWVLVAALALLVALGGCAETFDESSGSQPVDSGDPADDPPPGSLEIHHIDVGQADSTLLVTPGGETVLVDTGTWQADGERVLSYLAERGIDRIDHLVATHPHADHIGGHAAVIEYFEEEADGVGAVYDSGQPHDTLTYERYLDAVDQYGHELLLVEAGDRLPLDSDSVEALVVGPPGDGIGDLHENSIALTVEFGDVRYLTTGDAEDEAESRLAAEWADELDVDIYQAGHHGSSSSSGETLLDVVDPEVAVVSSGYDSPFGHPHREVLERLATRDVETYWTGVHGDVVVTTDGSTVDVTPAETFSTDPMDLLAEKPQNRLARMTATAGARTRPARWVS